MGARTRGIANQILSGGLDATDGLSGAVPSSNITNASVTSVSSTPSIGGGFDKVASDPPSPVEGDIWYNTTSNTVKGYVYVNASWATAPSMNTGRRSIHPASSAAYNAAMGAGGYTGGVANATEEYNGSSWTTTNNLNTARRSGDGAGIQTAGLSVGGSSYPGGNILNAVEEYDGSTWTNGGALPSARNGNGSSGTQTAALSLGGNTPSRTDATLEYNGSTWTSGGNFPIATSGLGCMGLQTAAVSAGGGTPVSPTTNTSNEYDGSTWTASNNLNVSRNWEMGAVGIQTAAFVFGGTDAELYDGTSWTTTTNMNVNTTSRGGAGTTTDALAFGGSAYRNDVEEFTGAVIATKTLTSS